MANSKGKSVDLGALQDSLIAARRQLKTATTMLERAQITYEKSKEEYDVALTELKEASRVVINNQ